MIYFCAQKNRRALVLQNPTLNGIDYLEVAGVSGCGQQLAVTLLKDARSVVLTPDKHYALRAARRSRWFQFCPAPATRPSCSPSTSIKAGTSLRISYSS